MTVPNLINDWGPNELLRRRYAVQEGAPAPSVAFEISPTVEVSPWSIDNDFLIGWRRCGGYASAAAVAANFGTVRLRNPSGSGIIAVVDMIRAWSNNNDIFLSRVDIDADLANIANSIPLDSRYALNAVTQLTACSLSMNQVGALPAAGRPFAYLVAPGVNFPPYEGAVVLKPGTSFEVQSVTANIAILANLRWRERRFLPGEV